MIVPVAALKVCVCVLYIASVKVSRASSQMDRSGGNYFIQALYEVIASKAG